MLKFRLRSEREIYQRLKKKKFNEEIIKRVLAFLKEKKFINDALFTKAWLEYRIKKPLGIRRLKEELKLKGIDKGIIESGIEEITKNYCEGDIAAKIAKERLSKLKDIAPQKAKPRIFSYLLRRGFSYEAIMDALNQIE